MKRILLTLAFTLLAASNVATADTAVYWSGSGDRVYVVDIRNIGSYGRLTLPRGYSRVVVRMPNGDWGVVPNRYLAPPRNGYRYGNIR